MIFVLYLLFDLIIKSATLSLKLWKFSICPGSSLFTKEIAPCSFLSVLCSKKCCHSSVL